MQYKKVVLNLKNTLKTPIESDTFLGQIFAFAFVIDKNDIKQIFEEFKNGEIPFLITNGFVSNNDRVFISRPLFFVKKQDEDENLVDIVKKETFRKKLKKSNFILFSKTNLENLLKKIDITDKEKKHIISQTEEYKNFVASETIWRVAIPRFNSGDSNPYDQSLYFTKQFSIYVKVFDESKFKKFFDFTKFVLENYGFGAGRTVGYGIFENIQLKDLTNEEKETFDFIENLKTEGYYLVLNNYKPTQEEITNFDLNNSFIEINWKNAKGFVDWNKQFFKGNLNFVKEGSVIKVKNNDFDLKGDFYKIGDSYNFGYIF